MRALNRGKSMLAAGAIGVLLSAGCSKPLSGTFEDEAGITSYEFESNGRARISVLGATVAAEYTRDGDRILVTSPQGTVVLTQSGDTLYGPTGLELVRQTD